MKTEEQIKQKIKNFEVQIQSQKELINKIIYSSVSQIDEFILKQYANNIKIYKSAQNILFWVLNDPDFEEELNGSNN